MAAPAKKGGLGLLLSMGEPDEGSDPIAEKKRAIQEMFAAGKRGDWEGAAHAFQEAYDICAGASVGDEEYSEDEGDEFPEE